jgi:hypothetical protein
VVDGVLGPDQDPAVKKAVSGLGDGVNANDKAFLPYFPYIADPWSGSDAHVGQTPVQFSQSLVSDRTGSVLASVSKVSPAQPGGFAVLYNGSRALVTRQLNSTGTAVAPFRVRLASGSTATLYWKVFTPAGSAYGSNAGVPTAVRIK